MSILIKNNDDESLLSDLILFLHDKKSIRLGDFVLSSGKNSKFYIDLRILQSHPKYFRMSIQLFKEYIISNIGLDNFDYICSIPTSGTIFGSSLAYALFKPHIYIRKNAKTYGTQKSIEGDFIPYSKVLFIDDVMTTGNSLISSMDHLKDQSIINDCLVFVDRQQSPSKLLKYSKINFHKIISINEIFEVLYKNKRINDENYKELKNELEKF